MQDPSSFQPSKPQFGEEEHLKCPRCDSTNTKFCYYNNYNLSQPRHFCKNCRRYWTKGGSLRNIPVGGGTRKNTTHSSSKKSSSTKRLNRSSSSSAAAPAPPALPNLAMDHDHQMLDMSGNLSFSSLLASTGQFGSLLESMNAGDSRLHLNHFGEYPLNPNANSNTDSSRIGEAALEMGDSSCWGSTNGWPDLAIYTPGSSFQ